MRKKDLQFTIIFIVGIVFVLGVKAEAFPLLLKRRAVKHVKHLPTKYEEENTWDLPYSYAQSSWPSSHRDSRNSNYLPFPTTDKVKSGCLVIEKEYTAVMNSIVIGPEGNIYFTTGKEESKGNLHALDQEGNELWRNYSLDSGAFCCPIIINREGDIYVGDSDEFFGFKPDGNEKWSYSGIEGPIMSATITLEGVIVGINKEGLVYVFVIPMMGACLSILLWKYQGNHRAVILRSPFRLVYGKE